MTSELPQRIGAFFRVSRLLARGGMGTVYEVVDERSDERLALKRMHDADLRVQALFEREYRTLLGMHHPRIVAVREYGLDGARPYYTMELLEGSDLHGLAPLEPRQACSYLRDVASALSLLHTRGFVHRDLTARNVRVTGEGHCKLLDFGAVAPFGVHTRIVGTPCCIAPEALRGGPLDQRTDLFALGALAYWLLTGQHAFPARVLEQLPRLWQVRPEPPSKHADAAGISGALDALVLQLLELDPAARPTSAAAVSERLVTLGQLPPEAAEVRVAIARSYFASPEFVGREAERVALQDALCRAVAGHGASLLLSAETGCGRSRLLSELVMRARQAGALALEVDAGAHPQLRGTAVALLLAALDASASARTAAQEHAELLAQADAGVAERLHQRPAAPESNVSGAWRARLQEAMQHVILSACQDAPLVIALDDVDEADEASHALLGLLGHGAPRHRLLLVASCTSETGAVPEALRSRSHQLQVPPLQEAELHDLVRSLFGDAPLLARFAAWLHEASGGRPLLAVELVKQLFALGELRYLDGLWVLPTERPQHLSRTDLDSLFGQRLTSLRPATRDFAELLALQRGALTRTRCSELGRLSGLDASEALEELCRAQVLLDQGTGYRFAQRALPRLLRAQLSAARARQLHALSARCGLALATNSEQLSAQVEAGFHLLEAGERSRGADLLAGVTYDNAGVRVAFADLGFVAPALEAALEVYAQEGRSIYERMPLVAALAQAGYYEDYRLAQRFGPQALEAVEDVLHVPLARQLRPRLGRNASLLCALSVAYLRFRWQRRHDARYQFRDALAQYVSVVTTLTGVAGIQLDSPRAEVIIRSLEPFSGLPERLTPVGVWEFCSAMAQIGRERSAAEADTCWRLFERFGSDKWYISLGPRERMLYRAGLLYSVGALECFRDRGGALRAAAELDALQLGLYDMIAAQLRALHHAFRGEQALAQRFRAQVELHAVRVGSAWQVEIWEPAALLLVQMAVGDTVEIGRLAEQLRGHVRVAPSLAQHARLAELMQRAARRDGLQAVVGELRDMLREAGPRGFVGWGAAQGLLAHALNELGQHAQALESAAQALAHVPPEDRDLVALFLGLELEHARALSGLGRHKAAARELDALLQRHARSDNPLTLGRLHEARAQVASAAQDLQALAEHARAARAQFAATDLPELQRRVRSLAAGRWSPSRVPPANLQFEPAAISCEAAGSSALQPLLERLQRATRSASCALFEFQPGAAPCLLAFSGPRPLDELLHAVQGQITHVRTLQGQEETDTVTGDSVATTAQGSISLGHAVYVLSLDACVVGAVTVDLSGPLATRPSASVLRELAAQLSDWRTPERQAR